METPYGKPSDKIAIATYEGKRIAFLPRHGKNHQFPPHMIPYRANLYAMKKLGVKKILAPTSSGSLRADISREISLSAISLSTGQQDVKTHFTTGL